MFESERNQSPTARVLVVDDSEDLRGLYSFLLLSDGYEVMLAADGIDAINKVLRCEYDVMLLDYAMPGMTGIEVLMQINALKLPRPPKIIMVSAYGDSNTIQQALNLGAAAYIPKGDVTPESLLDVIRKTCRSQPPPTPHQNRFQRPA